jgi:hypothetical protein
MPPTVAVVLAAPLVLLLMRPEMIAPLATDFGLNMTAPSVREQQHILTGRTQLAITL